MVSRAWVLWSYSCPFYSLGTSHNLVPLCYHGYPSSTPIVSPDIKVHLSGYLCQFGWWWKLFFLEDSDVSYSFLTQSPCPHRWFSNWPPSPDDLIKWVCLDQMVLGWFLFFLSNLVLAQVIDKKRAHDAWITFEVMYKFSSQACIYQLKTTYRSLERN